jgi:hypothetical protein
VPPQTLSKRLEHETGQRWAKRLLRGNPILKRWLSSYEEGLLRLLTWHALQLVDASQARSNLVSLDRDEIRTKLSGALPGLPAEAIELAVALYASRSQNRYMRRNQRAAELFRTRAFEANAGSRKPTRCACCGRPLQPDTAVVDHVFPWSEGGEDDQHNFQLTCTECNAGKRALLTPGSLEVILGTRKSDGLTLGLRYFCLRHHPQCMACAHTALTCDLSVSEPARGLIYSPLTVRILCRHCRNK